MEENDIQKPKPDNSIKVKLFFMGCGISLLCIPFMIFFPIVAVPLYIIGLIYLFLKEDRSIAIGMASCIAFVLIVVGGCVTILFH